ncbi:MAG: hypothetical protein R3D87_12220 [Paracoccaceae bacterium]
MPTPAPTSSLALPRRPRSRQADTTDALLAGLAAGADEVAAEADDTAAILGDLATTPEAEADADPSADILAGLAATPEVAAEADRTDALLAGLAAGADELAAEAEADADPSADILAGCRDPEVAERRRPTRCWPVCAGADESRPRRTTRRLGRVRSGCASGGG